MRVLRVPGFRLLLAGQAVNAIGNWVAIIAIWGFAAFQFDAGAGDLALLFVALSIPPALLVPVLGVWIDRIGPRRALLISNALGFANALLLTQADSYHAIIALALPLGVTEALAAASLDSLPPRMVPDDQLATANALLGGAQDLAIIVGPVVAAIVNARWGLAGAFLTDAATFLVGFAVAWKVKVGPTEHHRRSSAWRELREGLAIVRRVKALRWTLAVAAVAYSLWGLFGVLEPLYVRDVLEESDTLLALFQTVFGFGLVLTGLVLARLGDRVATPRNVAVATIVSGATAALYLGTESLAIAFVGVFLWGVDVAFFYVPAKTLLQRYAPTHAHGRVLALNQSLEPITSIVVTPLGAVVVGIIGVQLLGIVGGAIAATAGLIGLLWSRSLPPLPAPAELSAAEALAGTTSRDAVALGGQAPG